MRKHKQPVINKELLATNYHLISELAKTQQATIEEQVCSLEAKEKGECTNCEDN